VLDEAGQHATMLQTLPLLLALMTGQPAQAAEAERSSGVSTTTLIRDEADRITPVRISHHVDEIIDGDKLQERYNYLVYEFERDGLTVSARTYLDEVGAVAIFGPYRGRDTTVEIRAPKLEAEVVAYLQRRFSQIDRLSKDDASPTPYVTIWRRKPPL
jgi:hypothetical protein